jgi:hypothetical protein
MALIINKTTYQILKSANTPDFSENDWLINPDLSSVTAVPEKYWKVVDNAVVEMSSEEKAVVDAAAAQAYIESVIGSAIAFGSSLVKSFAAQNVLLGITQAGKTNEVRNKMSGVLSALQTGSLYDAIAQAKAIDEADYDSTFITAPRLLNFVNKLETYLGIPLSTEL